MKNVMLLLRELLSEIPTEVLQTKNPDSSCAIRVLAYFLVLILPHLTLSRLVQDSLRPQLRSDLEYIPACAYLELL